MLTANYSTTAAAQWTAAADMALAMWSEYIPVDVTLNISIVFDATMSSLATCGPSSYVNVGEYVYVPTAAHKIATGGSSSGMDMNITINPSFNWNFGDPDNTGASQYSLVSCLAHEIGHGLFAIDWTGSTRTPYELWAEDHASSVSGSHIINPSHSILFPYLYKGEGAGIDPFDVFAAGQSGVVTDGDDLIYVPRNSTATFNAHDGQDTAIYFGSFDSFNATLVNFEVVDIGSLSAFQEDLYLIYEAAFGRNPDLEGFTWWADSGHSLDYIADSFVASTEFQTRYAGEDFLTELYWNVHDRAPDPEGYAYWQGQSQDQSWLLSSFALSPENTMPSDILFIA